MSQRKTWCDTCTEEVDSSVRSTICTTCGETLQVVPNDRRGGNNNNNNSTIRSNNTTTTTTMDGRLDDATVLAGLRQGPTHDDDDHRTRATSDAFLSALPRTVVHERSSLLHEASVELTRYRDGSPSLQEGVTRLLTLDAVVAEFGLRPPYDVRGTLVRTGVATTGTSTTTTIAYDVRGGGITFARKARTAVAADRNVGAVVIGNSVSAWPYVPRDGKGEAAGLRIPVLMVKKEDGRRLQQLLDGDDDDDVVCCRVRATTKDDEDDGCIVCREPVRVGDTILKLPFCFHSFHEDCALLWLRRHNTCPTCRRELPTNDEQYETNRRREGRSHGGDIADRSNSHNWEGYYG